MSLVIAVVVVLLGAAVLIWAVRSLAPLLGMPAILVQVAVVVIVLVAVLTIAKMLLGGAAHLDLPG